jgi:hypothetical protein
VAFRSGVAFVGFIRMATNHYKPSFEIALCTNGVVKLIFLLLMGCVWFVLLKELYILIIRNLLIELVCIARAYPSSFQIRAVQILRGCGMPIAILQPLSLLTLWLVKSFKSENPWIFAQITEQRFVSLSRISSLCLFARLLS